MNNFFKSRFFIGLVIVTVIVLAISIFSTVGGEKASFVTDAVGVVVTPVQRFFYGIGSATGNFFGRFKSLDEYRLENQSLKGRIREMENATLEMQKIKNENERLRTLLKLQQEKGQFNMVAAEVSARDTEIWYSTFKINRGTSSGISKNDAVITADGLVGYIYEVGTTWATVVSIIDSKTSVGGIIERTGDRAIVEGDLQLMESGKCKMSYISKGANIAVGDYVQTSGLGGIYPEGIIIGKISGFIADEQGLYHNAEIETAVDFERINEVMVITK